MREFRAAQQGSSHDKSGDGGGSEGRSSEDAGAERSAAWGVLEVDAGTPRTFTKTMSRSSRRSANILGLALLRYEMERKAQDAATEYKRDQARADVLLANCSTARRTTCRPSCPFSRFSTVEPRAPRRGRSLPASWTACTRSRSRMINRGQQECGEVDFGDYLRALCANIDPQREGLMIEVDVSTGFLLPLDSAVPAGLIVNELVTNSLKSAFDEAGGTIGVEFTTDPDRGDAYLVVQDTAAACRSRAVPQDRALSTPCQNCSLGEAPLMIAIVFVRFAADRARIASEAEAAP